MGRGIAKVPAPLTEGLSGCVCKGTYTVRTGLRRDPVIFNDDAPFLPDASEKMDGLTAGVVGKEHRVFNSSSKLVRNGQTIGIIPMPDITGDSARASGWAYLMQRLLQCEVRFNPVSSHDNHMDREMQIQENKNQHHGDALPLSFKRIVKAARHKNAAKIWAYFEERVAASLSPALSPSPEPAPSSTASLSPALSPSPEPAPSSTASLSPVFASVLVQAEQIEPLPLPLPQPVDEPAESVSGTELQLLMTSVRENLTLATEYSDSLYLSLRDALRACLE